MKSVAVVSSHAGSGYSMRRYSRMLCDAYLESGLSVVVAEPADHIARRFRSPSIRKWAGYVDKFVLFPWRLIGISRKVDLLHVADHSDAMYCLLPGLGAPTTVTVHDLFAVQAALGQIPEHRTRFTGRLYQRLVRRGLARAGALLAVSGPSRDDVEQLVGRPAEILRSAVDPTFSTHPSSEGSAANPFALVVSDAGWRKRRYLSVGVWQRLNEVRPLRLVIVGPELTAEEAALLTPEQARMVTSRTDLDDGALAALYRDAVTVITMSSYEGLCWPIVEAQIWGTVPVCADEPIMHDTAGKGAVFVPATSVEAESGTFWSDVAAAVESEPLQQAAIANSAKFAWEPFREGLLKHACAQSPS